MAISLQRNDESSMFKKMEADAKEHAFKYQQDKSLPNHFNIVEEVLPRAQPTGTQRQKVIIPIPKRGLLGKMLLKWTFVGAVPANTSVHTGCNMAHTIKLRTDTLTLEQLTSEVIYQKIEEHSNESARALFKTLTTPSGYNVRTPLLFDFTRSLNGLINTVKCEPLHLELDMVDLTQICSNVGAVTGIKVECLCDFIHLDDEALMEHSKNDNPIKTMMTYVEDGIPNKLYSAGSHSVTLENSGLCKSIYICVKNNNTTHLNYRPVWDVELYVQGEKVFSIHSSNVNDYFNKAYIGMVSEVYNSPDSNIYHIRFATASRTNGNMGCLMLNGGDRKEEVTLNFSTTSQGHVFIVEEMYEQFHFRPDGTIKNVTNTEAKKMATPLRKRGRPKGSKNAPKAPEAGKPKSTPENKSALYKAMPEDGCNEIADTDKPKSKVHFATKKKSDYKGVSNVSMSVDKLQPEGGGTGGV
jgi:hypothetical protein